MIRAIIAILLPLLAAGYVCLLVFGYMIGNHEPSVPLTPGESALITQLEQECGCNVEYIHLSGDEGRANQTGPANNPARIFFSWTRHVTKDSVYDSYDATKDICLRSDSLITAEASRVAGKLSRVLNYRRQYERIEVHYSTSYFENGEHAGMLCEHGRTFRMHADSTVSLDTLRW